MQRDEIKRLIGDPMECVTVKAVQPDLTVPQNPNEYIAQLQAALAAKDARITELEHAVSVWSDEFEKQLNKLQAKEQELERVKAEVREWMCDQCNTVYPGPPTKGFTCVICPSCGGNTAPRTTIEMGRLQHAHVASFSRSAWAMEVVGSTEEVNRELDMQDAARQTKEKP